MTVGQAREEIEQLLAAAEADGQRSAALITLLTYNALRVNEALSRDIEHLGHQLGHRVLRISRRGGRDALDPLSAPVECGLDAYLDDRAAGALFVDDRGRRMYEAQAWRLVRRVARAAGLKSAGQLSPRSLRHTSPPASMTPASPCRTSRTRWVTRIPAPRAATRSRTSASTATRRTPSPPGFAAPTCVDAESLLEIRLCVNWDTGCYRHSVASRASAKGHSRTSPGPRRWWSRRFSR